MSEPLTREERDWFLDPEGWGHLVQEFGSWEATVRREEERALAAEARVRALEETLSEALGRA